MNTYYQWGRKDPDIPAEAYNTSSNHAVYDINGNSVSPTLSKTNVPIGTTIQNPLIHYFSNGGPYDTSQYNLWDAQNSSTFYINKKTVKTIYDPCPPGFCIPTADLWKKMCGNSNSSSAGTWENIGRLWDSASPHVFFPASGYRFGDEGTLNSVGLTGSYWSASPYSTYYGYGLKLNSSN